MQKTGRPMILWEGACIVHEIFSYEKILKLKNRHPEAKVIAHPECETQVLELADYIASTTGLLKFTINDPAKEFRGEDEQLDRAIQEMQEELKTKRYDLPAVPPFPNRNPSNGG